MATRHYIQVTVRWEISACLNNWSEWPWQAALDCFSLFDPDLCVSCSTGEGAGHHKVLPHVIKAWRLGVGAELRHYCPQQPLLQTSLYCQCELCPHVSHCPPPLILFVKPSVKPEQHSVPVCLHTVTSSAMSCSYRKTRVEPLSLVSVLVPQRTNTKNWEPKQSRWRPNLEQLPILRWDFHVVYW